MIRFFLLPVLVALAAFAIWWFSQTPSHNRQWADDVAHVLQADVNGDKVVLKNVRNFEWRTETDYTPRWETREYDLSQLQTADLVLSYWMGPAIAHTLVSFGFADGRYLTFSLEIRKEVGEAFSAWKGFFRQYEAILVAADEVDIIKTRSNARGEDVYIYRLAIPPEQLKTLFLAYVEQANKLEKTPEFYNTLTSNCTTVVFDIAKRIVPDLPLDYRLLLSGYFAEYAHAQGGLVEGFSYAELQEKGYIVPRAKAMRSDENFSEVIRRGVPGMQHGEQSN
ncbi:DUF4105 domain-containing protein [Limnobacter alexandrii]|uniref:Lnb N-terminal periplasmic domain-containing protein n=1 Tax=Limnobacter alexandrii TaxID=2570352 RepID=UPI001FE6C572|nr:DUF4105 domain-containing protein [Limnobacter alexandrii]